MCPHILTYCVCMLCPLCVMRCVYYIWDHSCDTPKTYKCVGPTQCNACTIYMHILHVYSALLHMYVTCIILHVYSVCKYCTHYIICCGTH